MVLSSSSPKPAGGDLEQQLALLRPTGRRKTQEIALLSPAELGPVVGVVQTQTLDGERGGPRLEVRGEARGLELERPRGWPLDRPSEPELRALGIAQSRSSVGAIQQHAKAAAICGDARTSDCAFNNLQISPH